MGDELRDGRSLDGETVAGGDVEVAVGEVEGAAVIPPVGRDGVEPYAPGATMMVEDTGDVGFDSRVFHLVGPPL